MPESQAIAFQPHAEVVWAAVHQRRLDDAAIDEMQRRVPEAAAAQPDRPVVLDMTEVEFVPSLGLGALVMLMRRLRGEGRRFILVGLNPDVRSTLAVTRLDKLFEIQPTLEEALKHLDGRSG
jgi:anti-anti-sigma factor